MGNKNNSNIVDILTAYIDGSISEKQIDELHLWIQEDRKNQRLFNDLLNSNHFNKRYKIIENIDLNYEWERLQKQHSLKSKKYKTLLFRIAAVSVPFFVGLSLIFFSHSLTESDQEITEFNQIDQVILDTGEGQIVNVDSLEDDVFIDINRTTLLKKGNQLRYAPEKTNSTLKLNTIIVPRGKEYSITLADGTEVMLNSESRLKFPTAFTESKRTIWLEDGEILLDVAHDKAKPFIVHTKGLEVEVLGTRFNVNSYCDNDVLKITLESGSISVKSSDNKNMILKPILIKPGFELTVNYSTKKMSLKKADIEACNAWTKGEYYFDNQSLVDILTTLSRWYDFDVKYKNVTVKHLKFTGRVKKYDNIEILLDALEEIHEVTFKIEGKTIIVQ